MGYCTGFRGARQAFTPRDGARPFAEAKRRSGSNRLALGTPPLALLIQAAMAGK